MNRSLASAQKRSRRYQSCYALAAVLAVSLSFQHPLSAIDGYANPRTMPYADPAGGRENYRYRNATKNEFRLYDFYKRQAKYYLSQDSVPEMLPAFPGLDAGLFGHWGKHNDMGVLERRWDRLRLDSVLATMVQHRSAVVPKGLAIRVPGDSELSVVFDSEYNIFRAAWADGYLNFPEARWGIMGIPTVDGDILYESFSLSLPKEQSHFNGYYLSGDKAVLSYSIGTTEILELPFASGAILTPHFVRLIEFPEGATNLKLPLLNLSDATLANLGRSIARINSSGSSEAVQVTFASHIQEVDARFINEGGILKLHVEKAPAGATISLDLTHSSGSPFPASIDAEALTPSRYLKGGRTRWAGESFAPNILRNSEETFAVDSLGVPLGNTFLSPMFLTGLDFFENGDAAISTFFGDVWRVSGFLGQSQATRWKRIATGLHHPMGIEIVDGTIHVIGRDQITALHDLNSDGEIDYYECVFNSLPTYTGTHDFNTGLQTDSEGNLYYAAANTGVVKISPDKRTASVLANAIRNPNGIGVSAKGTVLTSAQEGDWTPASMIIEASRGGSYGWSYDQQDSTPTAPLAYIPRGVDHSSGGQVSIEDDRWAPFAGSFVGLSYGACSFYLILKSPEGHGGIVPLPAEFLTGVHRARINPVDGQLYVVGTQGWGTYAQYEGSFERVRRTGAPITTPNAFRVFDNGIQLTFPETTFEPKQDPSAQFSQQWNYRYSSGYGSPEYSVRQPGTVGHDAAEVTGVTVSPSGDSVFFEIPDLQAAMQTHLYYQLATATAEPLEGEIFLTALELDTHYEAASSSIVAARMPKRLDLSDQYAGLEHGQGALVDSTARVITLDAESDQTYSRNSFSVRSGELITLRLHNVDTTPHNWVLGTSGSYNRIGKLAESLTPSSSSRIPDSPDILEAMDFAPPGEVRELTFTAPEQPGTYPFLCTDPSHWHTMKGTLIVY